MTDLDAAAATPQPEAIRGLALQADQALVPRTPTFDLPTLRANPTSWDLLPHAATLARMVSATDFVPSALRNKPASVAALILLGHELGLGPLASLQGLTVTDKGDIITYSKTLRAIVRSHGHRMWPDPDEYTSQRVSWLGYRADDPEHIMRVTWTMAEAKTAGLDRLGPSGRPGAWQKQPRAMLSARASAELARLLDEDGLLGISRVVEEMDDDQVIDLSPTNGVADEHVDEPDPAAPEGPKTRTRSTRTRTTPRTAEGMPQPDAPKVDLEVPGDTPETHTTAQAPAAGHPDSPSPVADLEVPGDDAPPGAPVSASTPPDAEQELAPAPTHDQVADELSSATTVEHMPNGQKIAMLCREAGIDKAELVRILTDKRSESAKDLAVTMQNYAIESLRSVMRGEMRYSTTTIPPFVVIPDVELEETARVGLSRLAGGDRLRPTLAGLGWDEERDGKVTDWLKTRDRQKLLETISAARAAQPMEAT